MLLLQAQRVLVEARTRRQRRVRTLVDHPPVIEHDDVIGVLQRRITRVLTDAATVERVRAL